MLYRQRNRLSVGGGIQVGNFLIVTRQLGNVSRAMGGLPEYPVQCLNDVAVGTAGRGQAPGGGVNCLLEAQFTQGRNIGPFSAALRTKNSEQAQLALVYPGGEPG